MYRATKIGSAWKIVKIDSIEDDAETIESLVKENYAVLIHDNLQALTMIVEEMGDDYELVDI